MAKRIKPEDLFDFDGYEQRIKEMTKLNQQFGKDNIDMLNHITDAQKPFLDNLQKFIDLAEKTNAAQKGATETLRNYEKATEETTNTLLRQKKLQDLLNDSYNSSEKSIKVLKDGVNILRNEYEKLDPTQKDFAEQQAKIAQKSKELKVAIDAQSAAMKAANSTVKAAAGSYSELNKETNELRNRLKNLPDAFDKVTGAINKTNKEAVELQRQIQQNDKVLKNFDASMGNHQRNVGNYTSALGGVTRSVGTLGLAFVGLDSAYTVIDKLFSTIVEFDRLDSALKNVTNSTEEFNQAQSFIERLANRNGQNIQVLTKSYMSLLAASRGTNLEGVQTQRIFTALTNAGAALKMSNDDLEGALRAVQQMMSKGNVSAEELRGQLGERLYGAFNLAAKAIGKTTAELGDMLKKGEVLASDLLPRFADELDKLYGDKAAQNLQTISGSWQNLKNQVSLLVKEISEKGKVKEFFAEFNTGAANTFRAIRDLVNSREWLELTLYTLSKVTFSENELTKRVEERANQKENAPNFDNDLAEFKGKSKKERDILLKTYDTKINDLNKHILDVQNKKDKANKEDLLKDEIYYFELIKKRKKLLEAEKEIANKPKPKGIDGDDDKKKKQLTQIEVLEKAITELNDVLENQVLLAVQAGKEITNPDVKKDLIEMKILNDEKVSATLKELEAKKEMLATVKEEIALMQARKKITAEVQQIDPRMGKVTGMKLERQFTGKVDSFVNVNPKSMGDRSQDIAFTGEQSGIVGRTLMQLEGAKSYKEILKIEKTAFLELDALKLKAETKGQKDRLDLAKKELDQKIEWAKLEQKEKEEIIKKGVDLGVQIANQSFDFLTEMRGRELETLEMQKEHELSIVGDNTEAKANIEKKFAGEILEIKRKQARADKAQAAFNIGINTAQAIVGFLNDPGGVPGVIMSVAAGVLGAVQLATVLAKPLPQFFKGTDNAPEGFAWVAEKGGEIRETQGKSVYYDKPQIVWLNQGDKIHTAEQTQKILAQNAVNQELGNQASQVRMLEVKFSNNSSTFDANKLGSVLEKALDKRPIYTTYLEDGELKRYAETVNSRTTYNDNRYSLPK